MASGDNVSSVLGDLNVGSKPKREFAVLELRAQGAQIRGWVESLADPLAKAYLIAYYLPKPMEERQPGGGIEFVDRFSQIRDENERAVAWWLLQHQMSGVHRIKGYREICAQYFLGDKMLDRMHRLSGVDFTHERLRKALKMDSNKVAEKRKLCIEMLKDEDRRAHAIADDRLVTAGLI